MDIFTKYNQNKIQDRQVDTLIGLSKGITANGVVDQSEAEFLQAWLIQNSQAQNPIILNLLNKVSEMLADNVLDEDESIELLSILHKVSGEHSDVGEVAQTSSLPLCSPPPSIQYQNKSFLFTGTCAYGKRKDCQSIVESLGGKNAKNVTKSLDYLVLGTYVTDSWIHENFGRKIERAMEYRESGVPISIISEQHWLQQSGL